MPDEVRAQLMDILDGWHVTISHKMWEVFFVVLDGPRCFLTGFKIY